MSPAESAWQGVTARVARAAEIAGRNPATVGIVAVSKTFPPDAIRSVYDAGARRFGENYVQEAEPKMQALEQLADIEWHLIGPLQSNKTKIAAQRFAWVHSIDREKIAERLSAAREGPPLSVCVQINVSGERTKGGVDPREAVALARAVSALPHLHVRGFMAIAEATTDRQRVRAQFATARECLQDARAQGLSLDTLSMGMSDDLECAISEGATLVRIGSAIFGRRTKGAGAA